MVEQEGNLLYTIKRGLGNPSFYYTLAYCTCVTVFCTSVYYQGIDIINFANKGLPMRDCLARAHARSK